MLGPLLLALLLLSGPVGAAGVSSAKSGFKVLDATTHSHQGQRLADLRIAFRFSPQAREALENGVAISVFVDLEVVSLGYLWDTTIATRHTGRRIQIHALSKQYQVKNLYTGRSSTYRSFSDMTANIGIIKNLPLIEEAHLQADGHYRLRVRASLDIESLPSPLRPLAYISAAWQLSSDWTSWPLQP